MIDDGAILSLHPERFQRLGALTHEGDSDAQNAGSGRAAQGEPCKR
jgi:hypothetical protein